MKFEVLKRSHLKRNILIGLFVVALISAVILNFTKAKYRVTQSIPLVTGTINYKLADLNVIAMYQENVNGEYVPIDTVPTSGYTLNEEKSYCEVNDEKDGSIIMNYDGGIVNIGVKKKGTKCYLYFDELVQAKDAILANYPTVSTRTFPLTTSSKVETSISGTIYKSADSTQEDDYGTTYYFAGNPPDNWVKFGEFYWRIIRINGDGTIKMIYQGASANTTGEGTQIGTSAFNSSHDRSEYVGLKYTTESQRGTSSNSTILTVLNDWYSSSGLGDYASSIDSNVGFCGDRNMANGYSWSSQPSSTIYYAAYDRLVKSSSNVNPTFKCSNSGDLYKIPVGLITADEVIMAGLPNSGSTTSNYLYTGQDYWTMSPAYATDGWDGIYNVLSTGRFNWSVVNSVWGVRPVINLKADVTITGGDGTSTNPYIVN